jgi:hypothetical protein
MAGCGHVRHMWIHSPWDLAPQGIPTCRLEQSQQHQATWTQAESRTQTMGCCFALHVHAVEGAPSHSREIECARVRVGVHLGEWCAWTQGNDCETQAGKQTANSADLCGWLVHRPTLPLHHGQQLQQRPAHTAGTDRTGCVCGVDVAQSALRVPTPANEE